MSKVVGILQSRMSSTRLPGKSSVDICGKPLTSRITSRLSKSKHLDELVLAIPDTPEDDELESQFSSECTVVRGSLYDVLDRFYTAAQKVSADIIVRLTGDNPLVDVEIVDYVIDQFSKLDVDYAGARGCPHGIGAEIFTFDALKRAHTEGKEEFHREHVTPYLYEDRARFKVGDIDATPLLYGIGKESVRLTVDTPEDLEVIRAIYRELLPVNPDFGMKEIAGLYEKTPELFSGNLEVKQKSYKETQN